MTAASWAALFAGLSFAATVGFGFFLHGRLTERVNIQGKTIETHTDRLDLHDNRLNTHGEKLAFLSGWKDGMDAKRGAAPHKVDDLVPL
jgi:hypothetical protein